VRQRRPFRLGILMTVTSTNVGYAKYMFALCSRIGVKDLLLLRSVPEGNAASDPRMQVADENWVDCCEEVTQEWTKHRDIGLWLYPPRLLLNHYLNVKYDVTLPMDVYTCTGATSYFYVRSNGEVFPCGKFGKIRKLNRAGVLSIKPLDILAMDLDDIMQSDSFKDAFRFYNDPEIHRTAEPCIRCPFKKICGSCPVELEIVRLERGWDAYIMPECRIAEERMKGLPNERRSRKPSVPGFPEWHNPKPPMDVTAAADLVAARQPRSLSVEIPEGLKLFNEVTNEYLILEDVAAKLWGLIDGSSSISDVIERYKREFSVRPWDEEDFETAVMEFFNSLHDRDLIIVRRRGGVTSRT